MILSTALSSVGEVVSRFRPPSSTVNYCVVHLAGSRDLTNFRCLDLVFWFRILRDGVHDPMTLTMEKWQLFGE